MLINAFIVHTRANQLLPQLLMDQFDTFPIQYRHIEHILEGVGLRKIFFYKKTAVRTISPNTAFVYQ